MRETARIARLLEQTFEGSAYYGPSVLDALAGVDAATAARTRPRSTQHLGDRRSPYRRTALRAHGHRRLAGSLGRGRNHLPVVTDTSVAAWQAALDELKRANRALVRRIEHLDDDVLTSYLRNT